jgi:predicted metalloprotease with PDZ domain
MKGLNIGKKIVKLLSKEIKLKIRPLNIHAYEADSSLVLLNVDPHSINLNMKTPVANYNPIHLKKMDIRENEGFKYILRNVTLSTYVLFFMYYLMKTANLKKILPSNKFYLGCTLKQSKSGLKIVAIKSESPAEKANLKTNDIITKIENKPVTNIEEFNSIFQSNDQGQEYKYFEVKRTQSGKVYNMNFSVKLVDQN